MSKLIINYEDVNIEYALCYSEAYFLGVLSGIAGLWMLTHAMTNYEKEVK